MIFKVSGGVFLVMSRILERFRNQYLILSWVTIGIWDLIWVCVLINAENTQFKMFFVPYTTSSMLSLISATKMVGIHIASGSGLVFYYLNDFSLYRSVA